MVTNNFKQAMKLILTNYNNRNNGGLPVKNTAGETKYLMRLTSWPRAGDIVFTVSISQSDTSEGIWIGSGDKQASDEDYMLESKIRSGLTAVTTFANQFVDENGNPQIKIVITLTNTSNSDITVAEVGFFQRMYCANDANGSGGSNILIMLDRSVLNTPATIPSGESAAITYTLKTVIV